MGWIDTLKTLELGTAEQAAALWNADAGSLEMVGTSANAVFRFATDKQIRYLRLTHQALRDHEFVAAGLDWLRHLHAAGAFVPESLPSARGWLIEDVMQGDGVFLASVMAGAPGVPLGDDLGPKALEAWGESLGRLHQASESYRRQPIKLSSGLEQWPESFTLLGFWANIQNVVSSDPELQQAHAELGAWLASLPASECMVTHGDFRPGNAIWDGSRVVIVDFDEPTLAWAEYDVARAMLRDACKPFAHPTAHLETFLRGYSNVRALPHAVQRVPMFVRVRALLMLAWSLEDASWAGPEMVVLRRLALEGWGDTRQL